MSAHDELRHAAHAAVAKAISKTLAAAHGAAAKPAAGELDAVFAAADAIIDACLQRARDALAVVTPSQSPVKPEAAQDYLLHQLVELPVPGNQARSTWDWVYIADLPGMNGDAMAPAVASRIAASTIDAIQPLRAQAANQIEFVIRTPCPHCKTGLVIRARQTDPERDDDYVVAAFAEQPKPNLQRGDIVHVSGEPFGRYSPNNAEIVDFHGVCDVEADVLFQGVDGKPFKARFRTERLTLIYRPTQSEICLADGSG
jgi:hypothetical protein